MGSFWGLSAATGNVPRARHSAAVSCHPLSASDMLASSIVRKLCSYAAYRFDGDYFRDAVLHVRSVGDVVALFILVTVERCRLLRLAGGGQRHQHDAGNAGSKSAAVASVDISFGRYIPVSFLPTVVQHIGVFLPSKLIWSRRCKGLSTFPFRLIIYFSTLLLLSFWAVTTFLCLRNCSDGSRNPKFRAKQRFGLRLPEYPFLVLGIYENRTGRLIAEAQAAYHAVETGHHDGANGQRPYSHDSGDSKDQNSEPDLGSHHH